MSAVQHAPRGRPRRGEEREASVSLTIRLSAEHRDAIAAAAQAAGESQAAHVVRRCLASDVDGAAELVRLRAELAELRSRLDQVRALTE